MRHPPRCDAQTCARYTVRVRADAERGWRATIDGLKLPPVRTTRAGLLHDYSEDEVLIGRVERGAVRGFSPDVVLCGAYAAIAGVHGVREARDVAGRRHAMHHQLEPFGIVTRVRFVGVPRSRELRAVLNAQSRARAAERVARERTMELLTGYLCGAVDGTKGTRELTMSEVGELLNVAADAVQVRARELEKDRRRTRLKRFPP